MSIRFRRPRRGRSVLLWALAAFVGVQLTASVLLDYQWPQVRFPKLYERVAEFEACRQPPDLLFLGSSRTEGVLHDGEVSFVLRELTGDSRTQCFNAAVPAGDLIVSERVLRALLDRGARPRFAVIEVCPEGLNRRNGWLAVYAEWILRWDDVPAYLKDLAVTANLMRFATSRVVPLYFYRNPIRQKLGPRMCDWLRGESTCRLPTPYIEPRAPNPVPDGMAAKWRRVIAKDGEAAPIGPNPKTMIGLTSVTPGLNQYRPGGNSATALDRLLALCRAHDIEPILLTVPLSSGHRECYTSEVEAPFQSFVATMTRKYGCRYVDCRDALPDHFFRDHHHATHAGGQVFSRKLALEVLAPMWSTR